MKKFLIMAAMMLSVFNINAEEKSDKYYATVLSVRESIKNIYEAIEKEIKSKPSYEEADEYV
jgi:ATP-dependent 26S proteasome regulatory subunit